MIIKLILLFVCGLIIGWILEFSFRSLQAKKIIKPRFADLQMYGFAGLFLYLISLSNFNLITKMIFILIFTTSLEFLTGFLFLKYKKIKLWDYSKNKFNYKGIICPLFIFIWLIISLIFYYLILPILIQIIEL